MKIVACVKAAPDPASRLVVDESRTGVRQADLTFVTSEADNYALEEALRLGEAAEAGGGTGEVVVLSLGGEGALRVLRSGLAMGAHRAIHLAGGGFAGGDEYATARALARAVEQDGGADLVVTGVQSEDGGAGLTGIFLAELLGWPHASVVIGIDGGADGNTLQVRRELEDGVHERVEVDLPAVLTIQYGINQPRYASLKGIMAAKKKEVKTWDVADLGLTAEEAGRAGSLYEVAEIFTPERSSQVEILTGSPVETALALVEKLKREAKVL